MAGDPKKRLTPEDQQFILDNYQKMTIRQMAAHVGFSLDAVRLFLKRNGITKGGAKGKYKQPSVAPFVTTEPGAGAAPGSASASDLVRSLRASAYWANLELEFLPEELKYFQEKYVDLMTQFKGDVLPSEETQIFQVIKFEILMSRNLRERKKIRLDVDRMEEMQHALVSSQDPRKIDAKARDQALALETQLGSLRAAEQNKTAEYVKLQERHEALMKAIKGVRDQRVKQFEDSKVNFLGVIKMLQQRDIQEREARQMELMKMAGKKAYRDLSQPYVYDDGQTDLPILSADTVAEAAPEPEPEPEEAPF